MMNAIGILVVEIIIGVLCVCLTLIWSARIMSTALTAALAALTAAVGRIAAEVSETAEAIRVHITSESGISAETLGGLTDRLTAAADALDAVQREATGAIEAPASDVPPASEPPADGGLGEPPVSDVPAEQPAPGADGLGEPPASDVPASEPPPSDLPPAGNQNGVGSEFAGGPPAGSPIPGADGGLTDAALSGEPPASDVPASDGGLGEPPAEPPASEFGQQDSEVPPAG